MFEMQNNAQDFVRRKVESKRESFQNKIDIERLRRK